jgi:hypothetical protein
VTCGAQLVPSSKKLDVAERVGFAGHQTFPFRYGWLKKAVDAIAQEPQVLSQDRAVVALGVGKNMVQSIRHWALATQVVELANGRVLRPSVLGRRLFGSWDPYLEDPASLWLVHWLLVSNPSRAAAWHAAFHRFPGTTFTKLGLAEFLLAFAERAGITVRESSVLRDVDCFVRTYVPSRAFDRSLPEDSFDCPLAELDLVRSAYDRETFQFSIGPKPTLPPEIFLFALLGHINCEPNTRKTLALQECLYGAGSPGQAFKLDESSIVAYLEVLYRLTDGAIAMDETAGLSQVYLLRDLDVVTFLEAYYMGGASRDGS